MKKFIAIFLVLIMLVSCIPAVSPAVQTLNSPAYFVSTTGNDANTCTITLPCKTIQHAIDIMKGGDTIYVRGGTYNEAPRFYYKTNTTGLYMTLTNYPEEIVILDGTGLVMMPVDWNYSGVVSIKKTDYVHISGLHVQNSQANGIDVSYSDHAIIDHNFTYNTVKSGISSWVATNVVIDSNDIERACNPDIAISPYYVSEENLTVSASVNVEVMNNLVHKATNIGNGWAGGEGINIKDASREVRVHNNTVHLDERPDGKPSNRLAFGLDAWNGEAYNVYYYNNIAYNNAYGFIVESEAGGIARDIFVYNNLAYNNNAAGFALPNWEQKTATKKNIQFTNNTSYHNGYGFWGNVGNVENILIKNNIFYQNTVLIQLLPGTESQYTIMNNFTTDPLFINPPTDLHLQPNSPACGLGAFPCTDVTPVPTNTFTLIPTNTSTPTPTNTTIPPTSTYTNTPIPPTSTYTATPIPATPTRTSTPIPTISRTPTKTRTPTPTRTPECYTVTFSDNTVITVCKK
jgi:hypothetical protein